MKLFSFKKKKPSDIKAKESKTSIKKTRKEEVFSAGDKENQRKEKRQEKKEPVLLSKEFTDNTSAIINPRITEKATDVAGANAYVFEVATTANKQQIKKAIYDLYGVTPKKVNVLSIPSKKVINRGRIGTKNGGKKAYVFLKEGDTLKVI